MECLLRAAFGRTPVVGPLSAGDRPASVRGALAGALLALLLVAPCGQAASRLSDLVASGQYEQAYQQARDQRAERAGQPRFDFYYGRAAIETDHLSEGIFALERVLIAQPGADRARLELARAYFLRGDDRRARREFNTVRAHNPPANVTAQIDRYLLAIRRRADHYETTVSGYLEAGFGHDSNANSATNESSVNTILGPIALGDSTSEESDNYGRLEGRVRISDPVAPDVNLIGGLGARGRFYQDNGDFNTGLIDGRVGAELRKPDWRLRGSLDLGRYFVNDQPYRDQVGFNIGYQRTLSKHTLTSASLDMVDFRYDDDRDYLDSTLWVLGGGVIHRFDGWARPTLTTRVYVGTQNADSHKNAAQANAERDLAGVRAALRLWLSPAWTARARLGYRHSKYDEAGLLFPDARDEDYYRAELSLDWRPDPRWRIGPHVIYENNDSNVALYDYERTRVELLARYDFF